MKILINIILSGLAVAISDYFLSRVVVTNFLVALVVVVVLGIINAFIRPIILLLTLPINLVTLGLFTFVINALMVLLAAAVVPGFTVASFWSALLFSLVFWAIKTLFNAVVKPEHRH